MFKIILSAVLVIWLCGEVQATTFADIRLREIRKEQKRQADLQHQKEVDEYNRQQRIWAKRQRRADTSYTYKRINPDGTVTTYRSYTDRSNGKKRTQAIETTSP